ncbi:MAG: endonuclease domain-containing protein [Candidatus Komeilibacteria bacterium]
MTKLFNKPEETFKRRILRVNNPLAELRMWYLLRNRRLNNQKFRRQYGIGSFVVDFYCPEAKLVIEIDGATHSTKGELENDQKRQDYIESLGLTVIRFTNEEVYYRPDRVLRKIRRVLKQLKNCLNTSSQPSP